MRDILAVDNETSQPMAEGVSALGFVIFVTGIPSSGKTTISGKVLELDDSFQLVEGDKEIRRMGRPGMSLADVRSLFRLLLEEVENLSQSMDVVVDASLPASYVTEARERFGDQAFFVSLRITENERQARERSRRDRKPVQWSPAMTALGGGPELYDLVIEASRETPTDCANRILEAARNLRDG